MKGLLIFLITVISFSVSSQTTNDERISEIPSEIRAAITAENYEKAADLKKEKELRMQIKDALVKQDYERAKNLNMQIKALDGSVSNSQNSNRIRQLENEMQQAIASENYKRAGAIKKEIEALKSGNATSASYNYTPTNVASTPPSTTVTNGAIPEPPFLYQVFLLKNGTLRDLEKTTGELKSSGGGFFYASATSSYVIDGPKSSVRLRRTGNQFVVKVSPGFDPSESIKLVKLDVRGKKSPSRYADQFKSTASMYHSETNKVGNLIEITFKPVSNKKGVFVISTGDKLESGAEYAFMYINKMYAFGID